MCVGGLAAWIKVWPSFLCQEIKKKDVFKKGFLASLTLSQTLKIYFLAYRQLLCHSNNALARMSCVLHYLSKLFLLVQEAVKASMNSRSRVFGFAVPP
jgi:hypothetical protein